MGTLNENIALNQASCFFCLMILGGVLAACLFTDFWRRKSFYRAFIIVVVALFVTEALYSVTWLLVNRGVPQIQIVFFCAGDIFAVAIFLFASQFLFCLAGKDNPVPHSLSRLMIPLTLMYLAVEGWLIARGEYSFREDGFLVYSSAVGTLSNCMIGIIYIYVCVVLLYSFRSLSISEGETVVLLISLLISVFLGVQDGWRITPIYISHTFVLLILYQTVCKRRNNHLIEQDRAIAEKNYQLSESRIRLMVSQIQPHFLYNSLTAIANLCDTEPKRAREITLDFSKYLSQNLKFMQEKEPVPFSQELEFIRLYTNIEKARFGNRLHLEYSIGTMEFTVPALTVQPLVENAIRHGVTVRPTGGTVWLTTEEREDCFAVIVKDDGVGFNQGEVDWSVSSDHYGIDYIRTRIREQMGGDLFVNSRPKRGTTAELTIPKEMRS